MTPVRQNKFYSLRSRLTLMAMAVVFIPMLLATVFAFFSQKKQIEHSLTRELNASHSACLLFSRGLQERLERFETLPEPDRVGDGDLGFRFGFFQQPDQVAANLVDLVDGERTVRQDF